MTVRIRVTLAVVCVVWLCASMLLPAQGPPISATMTLAMSNGTCGKSLVGNDGADRIRTRPNGPVRWEVVNNCSAVATVQLTNFVRKSDNTPNFPFAAGGNTDCQAASGGSCTMTVVVRGDAETTTYSYTTVINGVAFDPDIIIER